MTLEEKRIRTIKQIMEIAEHYKHGNLHGSGAIADFGMALDQYREFVVQAKLAEAAEKAELKQEGKEGTYKRYYIPFKENPIVVDKESITSIPLD